MSDDDFQKDILNALLKLNERGDTLTEAIDALSTRLEARLDAVVARLDEQDLSHERLVQKVDRLSQHVSLASQASEQALDAMTNLSKRVAKLEYPGPTK